MSAMRMVGFAFLVCWLAPVAARSLQQFTGVLLGLFVLLAIFRFASPPRHR